MLYSIQELFAGTYTIKFLRLFYDLYVQLFPYAISGVVLVAFFNTLAPREKLAARLRGKRVFSLFFASVLGAVSPIPTYSLIPMIASMEKERSVPTDVLVAFLISSPLINPLLFIMTYGAFGAQMAVARSAAAVILGMAGGFIAGNMTKNGENAFVFTGKYSLHGCKGSLVMESSSESRFGKLKHAFIKEFRFVFRVFSISVVVAALAGTLIPVTLLETVLGGNQSLSVFAAVALGIPLYACGGGAIPVMQVLYESGLSGGAVLAFFISGPGTRLSTIAALFTCMPRKLSVVYVSVIIIGAVVFGFVYNIFAA